MTKDKTDRFPATRAGGVTGGPRRPGAAPPPDPPRCASSPCMAAEVAPDYFDPLATDPVQARDVARWRKAERARLRAARAALSVAERKAIGVRIAAHLHALLEARFAGARGRVFSAYWPINGEPDLRPVMAALHDAGARIALPVVERKAAPLAFRLWTPETRMVRSHWNIPAPPPEAASVIPEIALAPLVGWTADGYRLGYGGGYFDRTLAALSPRPATLGVGYEAARLATIYPQPHDIPLDAIVTEQGERTRRGGP